MATYTLRRKSDGKLITTTSAVKANDLVANGVAQFVKPTKPVAATSPAQERETAQPKRRTEEK